MKRKKQYRVSIPYKSGQHFKIMNNKATRSRKEKPMTVSIPYKSGQHFKKNNDGVHPPRRPQGFQSPTNRVNTSKIPSRKG